MTGRAPGLLLGAVLAFALVAGCGEEDGGPPRRESALVNAEPKPLINSLEIDPADGSFLLTTNKGFFRVDKGGKKAEPVKSTVTAKPQDGEAGGSSPVGTFLAVTAVGPGRLIGSGHPDKAKPLPEFLGFMTSDDGGRRWEVVSRLGMADFHVIRQIGDRIFGIDAVLGALLVSGDGGKTFAERFTPQGQLVFDWVANPQDPKQMLLSTEDTLYRSTDEGESWRPMGPGSSTRLAWPAPGTLYRADAGGNVQLSKDGGESFEDVGRIDGEPWKLKAVDEKTLYAALGDAAIHASRDGGRTWEAVFTP